MILQIVGLCESLEADSTLMSLSGVYVLVLLVIASCCKRFITGSTLIRFLPSVCMLVFLACSSCAERFVADSTLIRFLPSVYATVLI